MWSWHSEIIGTNTFRDYRQEPSSDPSSLCSTSLHHNLSKMSAPDEAAYAGFYQAILGGTLDDVKAVLIDEIDINALRFTCDQNGWQAALHLVAKRGHVGMVELLLIRGADINLLDFPSRCIMRHRILMSVLITSSLHLSKFSK